MKQNELMIHNYVSFEGHPVCITKIGLTGIEGYLYKNDTLYDVKLKYEDIEPIPITEKLLMKNGFESVGGCHVHLFLLLGEVEDALFHF